MPARERNRLDHLLRRRGLQHETRRAAAHIRRPHVGILEVARFDRPQPGRDVVVGDAFAACGQRGGRAHGCVRRAAIAALARHDLAHAGGDILSEALEQPRVVAGEDEGADAVVEREAREPIGEFDGVGGELPDVQEPADLARIAPDGCRRLVDRRVALREVARLHVPERREPAIAFAPGQREHARLVGADPDRDVVSGARPALGAVHAMVPPVGEDAAPLARVPQFADHVDRLLERGDRLARAQPGAAHRLDRVPEAAGAESEVESPAGEEIEAGRAAGDDRRRPQRDVEHVGGDAHALGPRRDEAHERPGVQECGLVRVVLEGHQVEAGGLGRLTEQHRHLWVRRGGSDEGAEFERVSVVHEVLSAGRGRNALRGARRRMMRGGCRRGGHRAARHGRPVRRAARRARCRRPDAGAAPV